MKLDDVDLIKRVDKEGKIQEIRSIHNLSIYGKRRIVELPIPGSVGNVFQDMGRNPIMISFEGELVGPESDNVLLDLNSKFELKKPLPFSTDIVPINGINEVVIYDFAVNFSAGINQTIRYMMVLKENKSASTGSPRGPGETKPPSQEESSKRDIEQKISTIFKDAKSGA